MILRLVQFWVLLLCVPLLSCVGEGEQSSRPPLDILPQAEVQSAPDIKMAQPRPVNVDVMDTHLAQMIAETQAIEMQLGQLTLKLRTLKDQIHATQAVTTAPVQMDVKVAEPRSPTTLNIVPQKPLKTVIKTPVKPAVKGGGVQNVRLGIHADKTRLVFDVDGSTVNKVDFDKESGVLTISLPQTKWNAEASKTYQSQQLAGYQAKNSAQGSIVAFSVKNTSAVKSSTIAKTNGKPARLVVDLIK